MGRYLDIDLDEGVLSEENLGWIHERILMDYGVNLELISEDGFQDKRLIEKIAQKYQLNEKWSDFRKLIFLKKDLKKFDESIEQRLQWEQGEIIRANKKSEIIESEKLSADKQNLREQESSKDQEVLKLYEKITEKEEKIKKKDKKKLKNISYEDCVAIMGYILTNSRVTEKDIILQYFMRHKYTQMAMNKYRFADERKDEKIDCRSRLKSLDVFPMKDSNCLPVFIKELQDILFTQKYIRLFDFTVFGSEREEAKGSLDITRYSYKYIEEIYSKLEGVSYENLYYLNDMLGISLTNTIFLCIYNRTQKYRQEGMEINYKIINKKLFDVATLLGKFKCIYSRDILAKIIFKFLLTFDVNKKQNIEEEINRMYESIGKACDQICSYLETNIDRINCYYRDLCDAKVWLYANDDLRYGFDEEMALTVERECEIWMKKYIRNKTVDKVIGNDAMKWRGDYKLREMKLIKEPDNLYAQLHMAVMKGIWR